jgi:hypothetical protein
LSLLKAAIMFQYKNIVKSAKGDVIGKAAFQLKTPHRCRALPEIGPHCIPKWAELLRLKVPIHVFPNPDHNKLLLKRIECTATARTGKREAIKFMTFYLMFYRTISARGVAFLFATLYWRPQGRRVLIASILLSIPDLHR